MFDRLKKCPGCARRRARLAAWLEGLKVAAAEVLPAFREPEDFDADRGWLGPRAESTADEIEERLR